MEVDYRQKFTSTAGLNPSWRCKFPISLGSSRRLMFGRSPLDARRSTDSSGLTTGSSIWKKGRLSGFRTEARRPMALLLRSRSYRHCLRAIGGIL